MDGSRSPSTRPEAGTVPLCVCIHVLSLHGCAQRCLPHAVSGRASKQPEESTGRTGACNTLSEVQKRSEMNKDRRQPLYANADTTPLHLHPCFSFAWFMPGIADRRKHRPAPFQPSNASKKRSPATGNVFHDQMGRQVAPRLWRRTPLSPVRSPARRAAGCISATCPNGTDAP